MKSPPFRLVVGALLFWTASPPCPGADAAPPVVRQRGDYVHDPSTLATCAGQYWVFSTGPGIVSWHSTNRVNWQRGPRVFPQTPAWTTNAAPANRGNFWAPDIVHLEGRYLLYYSVSSWGVNTSAIGLATNATLDPASPNFRWVDCGEVIRSRPADPFNTIDPSVLLDADGRLWLAFGSYWSGLKLVELDPATGLRRAPDSTIYPLAAHDGIEASCLCQHGDFYYLFENWGLCCRGTNSTYEIHVGRSRQVTGPYLDRSGKNLLDGGGTLFLHTEGAEIGPGHAGVFTEGDRTWFSYHFYDGQRNGLATLMVRPLRWSPDGWPELAPSP